MVNTLVDNEVCHRSGKNLLQHFDHFNYEHRQDKSKDHAENLSICLIEHLFMDINGLNWVYTGAWEVSIKCHWPGSAENEFKTKHSTKITNLKQAVTFKSIVTGWSTNVMLHVTVPRSSLMLRHYGV